MIASISLTKIPAKNSPKLSSVRLNNINHHHLKSETTGKTVLLSEFGIQRRFSGTPGQGIKSIRDLFPRFLNLR